MLKSTNTIKSNFRLSRSTLTIISISSASELYSWKLEDLMIENKMKMIRINTFLVMADKLKINILKILTLTASQFVISCYETYPPTNMPTVILPLLPLQLTAHSGFTAKTHATEYWEYSMLNVNTATLANTIRNSAVIHKC